MIGQNWHSKGHDSSRVIYYPLFLYRENRLKSLYVMFCSEYSPQEICFRHDRGRFSEFYPLFLAVFNFLDTKSRTRIWHVFGIKSILFSALYVAFRSRKSPLRIAQNTPDLHLLSDELQKFFFTNVAENVFTFANVKCFVNVNLQHRTHKTVFVFVNLNPNIPYSS